MENNVQVIFSFLISVIIFFMLPIYMTFEKKDDISYALALRVTSNFVDNVKSKGYVSRKMYDDFASNLGVTDNIYKIEMEHVSKRYNPVIYVYDNANDSKIIDKLDYIMYKNEYETYLLNGKFRYNNVDYMNITLSYSLEEERFNTAQILDVLDRTLGNSENQLVIYKNLDMYPYLDYTEVPYITNMYGDTNNSIYTMSVGDEFNIIIKNENVTTATVLFNTMTMGIMSDNIPKVYINYGATIANESYK